MLEDYLTIKNGQELIDKGIIPKTSAQHLALITVERLKKLKDQVLETLTDEMLGEWEPLIKPVMHHVPEIVTTPEEIVKYAKTGMRVRGTKVYDRWHLEGLEGTIRFVGDDKNKYGIEFDDEINGAHDLKGRANCKPGHGLFVNAENISLIIPEQEVVVDYEISDNAVADKQFGHKVLFKEDFKGHAYDQSGRVINVEISKNIVGRFIEYNADKGLKGLAGIELENRGKITCTYFMIGDVADHLMVSSLGMLEPLDKETEVRKQVYSEFFPTTVLDEAVIEKIALAYIMEDHVYFHGPPGVGKTNLKYDTATIAQHQKVIFKVRGCQVQCNPFSVFDEEFAKSVDACPECKIKYDDNFKETGIFRRPEPEQVEVVAALFREGYGIEMADGSPRLNRMHLAGVKYPDLKSKQQAGDKHNKDYDPEGFEAGKLSRANNGLLLMDEMDKLRPQTVDDLLKSLENGEVTPEQLRFSYPANYVLIGTGNEHVTFSDAFNDRVAYIAINRPEDVDTSYGITRKGYHKERSVANTIEIKNTHVEKTVNVRATPIPTTIERATEALFLKFGKEREDDRLRDLLDNSRTKYDAFDAAKAKLNVDQIFFAGTPSIVTAEYMVKGVQYAFDIRVAEKKRTKEKKIKADLASWVEEEFPGLLEKEEETWWCRVQRHIAITERIIPGTKANYLEEMFTYETNPTEVVDSFTQLKKAYDNPHDLEAQKARLDYPFMNFLFKEQPQMKYCTKEQLIETMDYFMATRQDCCGLETGKQEEA